jgi:hypothetical protein
MSAVPVSIAADIDPLADAVEVYIAAKRAEDVAREARLVAEDRILALHAAKEEGSETFEAGGFKVTLTGKLAYKCDDPKSLAEACAGMGWAPNMIPVKTEVRLDETGCKYLRHNEPQAWSSIARFVTVKPAKVAVKVAV